MEWPGKNVPATGFEPATLPGSELESDALDHSATLGQRDTSTGTGA